MYQITVYGVLALLLVLSIVACDSLDSLGGRPSTDAPNTDDMSDLLTECRDRERVIDSWEDDEERRVSDDVIDGKITLLRAGVEYERIEEDARDMRRKLDANCQAKVNELKLPGEDSEDSRRGRGPFPTVTPQR